MTLNELVTYGLQKGGVSSTIAPFVKTEFKAWLHARYTDWPWPYLQQRAYNVPLLAGTKFLSFGMGDVVPYHVHEVKDPVLCYDNNFGSERKLRVRALQDASMRLDEALLRDDRRGVPNYVKVQPSTSRGEFQLFFDLIPDRNLLLAIDHHFIPNDPGDDDAILYPNDLTLMKACEVIALHHRKADNYAGERDVLASMIVDDRIKHGSKPGINQDWGLDPNTYR
jgi:hypothetical protein